MMANYPFFGFPNYINFMNNGVRSPSPSPPNFTRERKVNINNTRPNLQKIASTTSNANQTNDKRNLNSDDAPIINLFGINLYFDDILIICLIFFLYNEKVTDYYLFFVLILLLLS